MEKTITKIEVQKKNKKRVNVYLDEEFAFACSTDLVYYYRLEKNKKIDVKLLEDIIEEDNYLKAKNSALNIIEKSYKTEKQMFEKLVKIGYNEKTSARVMDFLREYSFVDDFKYTDMFIKDKSSSCGKNKIKYMLLRKGISEEIVEEGLKKIDCDFEINTALKLAEKKYNIIFKSEKNRYKIYKKLGDYLISRGYEFNIVNNVLNKVVKVENEVSNNENKVEKSNDIEELKELAEKRYRIISKSEKDEVKLYRKLGQYLIRRGYEWQDVKKVLKEII